jgi:hypothetical protein
MATGKITDIKVFNGANNLKPAILIRWYAGLFPVNRDGFRNLYRYTLATR